MPGRGGRAVNTCGSCHAAIDWVRTAKGRPMPLDPGPNPDGNVVLVHGQAVVLSPAALALAKEQGDDRPRYMPHWATCPNRAQHRKAKQ